MGLLALQDQTAFCVCFVLSRFPKSKGNVSVLEKRETTERREAGERLGGESEKEVGVWTGTGTRCCNDTYSRYVMTYCRRMYIFETMCNCYWHL